MLILKLALDLVPRLVHCVQLLNKFITVSLGLIELRLHLVIVDLQSAQLELQLICLELC